MGNDRRCRVRASIVRWVDDAYPGFVELVIVDIDRVEHHLVEKVPVVYENDLTRESSYPVETWLAATIVGRDNHGNIIVDTDVPWGLESIEGQSKFVVEANSIQTD